MTIIIEHEKYGDAGIFDSTDEAEQVLNSIGGDFKDVKLRATCNGIVDETGEVIGHKFGEDDFVSDGDGAFCTCRVVEGEGLQEWAEDGISGLAPIRLLWIFTDEEVEDGGEDGPAEELFDIDEADVKIML